MYAVIRLGSDIYIWYISLEAYITKYSEILSSISEIREWSEVPGYHTHNVLNWRES